MSNASSIIFLKLLPLLKLLQFYYYDKVFRLIDKSAKSVADMDCGKGLPMEAIKHRLNHKPYALGIDIFRPYIILAKKLKIHDEYVICDVRFCH
jgi:predicted TPR repeat methyltransferase